MGFSAERPNVKVSLTRSDATRLAETLGKNREPLAAVTDDVGKAQREFLDQVIATLQSAIKAADDKDKADMTGTPVATPAAT